MKNQKVIMLSVLSLAIAITAACGGGGQTFNKMALVSDRDGATNLYVAKLDGSNLTAVSNGPASAWSPTISANGKKIAFLVEGNVWSINSDGSGGVQLTTYTNGSTAYEPRISPDGKQIVYALWDEDNGIYSVRVMNADGSDNKSITATLPEGMEGCYSGSFSANGHNVVFACFGEDVYAIFTANSDGSNPKSIVTNANTSGWYDLPMFSPDNKKILFEGIGLSLSSGVRSRAAASQKSNVDGPRVAHSKVNPHGINLSDLAIYSVNLDGSGLTQVVPTALEGVILNSSLYYSQEDESQNIQIWKSAVDGTGAIKISDGTAQDRLGLSFYQFD